MTETETTCKEHGC